MTSTAIGRTRPSLKQRWPVPEMTRLEYLTAEGWQVGHAGIALLDPEAYITRLSKRGEFGRATVLDDLLQPTDRVYVAPNVPDDLSSLVATETHIPGLRPPQQKACQWCSTTHDLPHDGMCLIA